MGNNRNRNHMSILILTPNKEAKQNKTTSKEKDGGKAHILDTCVGAFVTFNNEESFAVCCHSYSNTSQIARYFQPRELRFVQKDTGKQFPLKVVRAPEPDDLRWENLEYDFVKAHLRYRAVRAHSCTPWACC